MKYLYILKQALIWLLLIYYIYQFVIAFCSLIRLKEKPLLVNKKHKFMLVLPAHNEELVIKNLIDSLKAQDYPDELYDIYVIADNCTDATASIAKESGAIVHERHDEKNKTKGHALSWFLNKKIKENADYDAFCVFDADNIVDKNFLNAMNKKLCQGENVVQGYRDIKNPTDSWIASGYALFYWMQNRFYHLARYKIGLSPLINGTGFMVRFDLIKPTGWNTKTLTEDIEFSLINIAQGRKLAWATDAIVYDEQPITFKQSWSQRSRWTVGHMQCAKYYTKDLASGVIENKTMMNFDGFLYIMCIPIFVVSIILTVINVILYLASQMTFGVMIFSVFKYLGAAYLLSMSSGIMILLIEKRPIKPMIKGLIFFPIFLGSWMLINLKCLIKPNTKWDKITHDRNVNINQV